MEVARAYCSSFFLDFIEINVRRIYNRKKEKNVKDKIYELNRIFIINEECINMDINYESYPEYLYQYTSIETLALILESKKIRFNSLKNVDDLEEVQSKDIKNYGKFTFVSCWTNDEKENIALWNMYAGKMKGVRIKLPTHCFIDDKEFVEKQLSEKGLGLVEFSKESFDTDTGIETKYNPWFAHFYSLIKICYTKDESKINESIVNVDIDSPYYRPLEITKLGDFKRKEWEFQKEWRYIIHSSLKGWKENDKTKPTIDELRILEEFNNIPDGIYVSIDNDKFKDMEVLLGPNTSNADKIIVESLLEKYNPNAKLSDSYFKNKIKCK